MKRETLQIITGWLPFRVFRKACSQWGMSIRDYNGTIIEPIKPSTITAGGQFSGVELNETTDIPKFATEIGGTILAIGSNFGELPTEGYVHHEKKIKTSKRGRKPKPKEPRRRIQGNGRYFNSQITFVIRSAVNENKKYKCKVYRNGKYQVPGVLTMDQSDINEPLETLRACLARVYNRPVEITNRVVQMRNYKTILSDLELNINTMNLGRLIEYDVARHNEMKIDTVEYQTAQNSSKVVVKFSRPVEGDPEKQTTLKILKQKINFEGAVGFDDVLDIYWWFNDFLLDNYNRVINDPLNPQESSSESDSSDTDESVPTSSRTASTASANDTPTDSTVKPRVFAFDPYNFD